MANYLFRVFNPQRQLVSEQSSELRDIQSVVAQARTVAHHAEIENTARCDGWTVDIFGPSGTLIMSLPWHFACQCPRLDDMADVDRASSHALAARVAGGPADARRSPEPVAVF